jgi:hypothetical protein
MNSNAAAILTNPDPCGHIVYPYASENQVSDAVCLFVSAGLRKKEAVILVMTRNHHGPIRERLISEGFDLFTLEGTGQLVCIEAEALMSRFLFDGIIDEHKFKTLVGDLIEKAKKSSADQRPRPVRVFGEMVSLLWGYDPKATTRLEELWNQVIAAHSVPLLCAYALAETRVADFPASLLNLHSHTIT